MAHLGEANILGLAFFPESIKGADGLLDRRLLVDPVQEVRVRVESAEPLDGLVERLDRPLGGAVHPEGLLLFVPAVAELVDQEDLSAERRVRLLVFRLPRMTAPSSGSLLRAGLLR